jgi:hypothetical protein
MCELDESISLSIKCLLSFALLLLHNFYHIHLTAIINLRYRVLIGVISLSIVLDV